MNRITKTFALCCSIGFLSGCAILNTVEGIYNEDVEPQYYSYGDKSLIFVPIVHFGQKTFYANLKDSIDLWKADSYTVFYEEIKNTTLEGEELNLYALKWRKITGGTGKTRADYAELEKTFEGGIVQPEYDQLGIDDTDINADITFAQLIDKYEEVYGTVEINECDRSTPLDSVYSCGEKLNNDLSPVNVDYRNEQLAQRIISSELKKIVIIYGKDHMEGVQQLLGLR